MPALLTLIQLGLVLGALGVAGLSILALFGFAVPELDLLNHGQILLLPGSAIAVVVLVIVLRGRFRVAATVFALAGLAASANVMLPEYLGAMRERDRKSTRLNSSHVKISYAVFCLKKKK